MQKNVNMALIEALRGLGVSIEKNQLDRALVKIGGFENVRAANAYLRKQPQNKFVIASDSENGFWSNTDGWGDFCKETTIFTEKEKAKFKFPSTVPDCTWVSFDLAPKYFSREAKYLRYGYDSCPCCVGTDIRGGSIEVMAHSGQQASAEVSCDTCGAEWTDNWSLTGFEILTEGDLDAKPLSVCKQCEEELDENGYCTSSTCVYSDLPQHVSMEHIDNMEESELRRHYSLPEKEAPNNVTHILQHRIEWWLRYEEGSKEITELDEMSIEHITNCIGQGFNQGELFIYVQEPGEDDPKQFSGWWMIA